MSEQLDFASMTAQPGEVASFSLWSPDGKQYFGEIGPDCILRPPVEGEPPPPKGTVGVPVDRRRE